MVAIVWRFRVIPEQLEAFLLAYGPEGVWAQLFRQGDGFVGTELLRSLEDSTSFLTIDRWR